MDLLSVFGYNEVMRDPFALLPVAPEFEKKEESRKTPKKLYWIIGVLAGLVLLFAVIYFLKFSTVTADVAQNGYNSSIEISGLPKDVKSGDEISITISVSNKTNKNIPTGYVLVASQGANLSGTIDLVQNLSESEVGFLRGLNPTEIALFPSDETPGFYWNIGPLSSEQTKSQQVKAVISGTVTNDFKIDAKYYLPKYEKVSCGALGLKSCEKITGQTQIGYESFQQKLSDQARLKLRSGYNYISLPYIFSPGSVKEFLSSLKDKWAYYYNSETAAYVDLNQNENANLIKPGVGFWIFDSAGGEYSLPETRVETNINDNYTVNLNTGWNQIGNPYAKRIVLSGEKILVREIADDGSQTGNVYSLKSAIDNKIFSVPYIVTYKAFTNSSATVSDMSNLLEYQVLPLESTLNPFSGLTINSTKKVALIFPGSNIIAPGDLLTAEDKSNIESWIVENGLNQYGDSQDTVYTGGSPLTDSTTGASIDRFDYIISKHPNRPWNKN